MIDIEQTKKLNFMIKELTRTGAVSSFDDAVTMAGNVYDGGLPKTTTSSVIAQDGDRMRELVDMRIRHHLANHSDQVNQRVSKLVEQNQSLSAEIKQLWGAIESLKQSAPRAIKPEEIDSTKELKVEPRPEPQLQPRGFVEEKKPEQATVCHPRSGAYNSQDVALDKFFYFGRK